MMRLVDQAIRLVNNVGTSAREYYDSAQATLNITATKARRCFQEYGRLFVKWSVFTVLSETAAYLTWKPGGDIFFLSENYVPANLAIAPAILLLLLLATRIKGPVVMPPHVQASASNRNRRQA